MRARRRALALISFAAVLVAGLAVARPYIWPDKHGASTSHFDIDSRLTHHRLGVSVVVPAGAGDGRPLLVFLHGRNGTENSELRNEAMYAGLAKLGDRAPVVALPYGGKASYWHDRRGGRWDAYVMREVIPAVERRFHTDPRRVAIGGISMGGFGAFDIARAHPGHFCAVGGHSPAIWQTGGETAPGAFDDAADFARNDLVGTARRKPGRFAGPRVWVDAGRTDPFQPGDRAFVQSLKHAGLPISAHLTWLGGHEHSYWQRHWPTYLAFYATALAHCAS
jgi:S-formylglutathione hydrolase FrmB